MAVFKLTKKTDYALSLLATLATKEEGELINLTMMQKQGLPRAFMAQITKLLVKGGVLESFEGRNGGYRLNGPAKKIRLKKVIEILEGEVIPVSCLDGGGCLVKHSCQQRGFMKRFASQIEMLLADYTVADLAGG